MDARKIRSAFRFFDSFDCFSDFFEGSGHHGREHGGHTGFGIGTRECTHFCCVRLHDVNAASAVRVNVNESRQEIAACGIDDRVGEKCPASDKFIFKAKGAEHKCPLFCMINVSVFNFGNHREPSFR